MTFYSDSHRHLICVPYSVENLHAMAKELGIKRCWFHAASRWPHYDIPQRRVDEIRAKTTKVSQRELFAIVRVYKQLSKARSIGERLVVG